MSKLTTFNQLREAVKKCDEEIRALASTVAAAISEVAETVPSPEDLNKIRTDIANKVDKVNGKGLSTNDFNTKYKGAIDAMPNSFTSMSNYDYDAGMFTQFDFVQGKEITIPGEGTYELPAPYGDIANGLKNSISELNSKGVQKNKTRIDELNSNLNELGNAIDGLNSDSYWEQGTWNVLGQKSDTPTIIRTKEKLILPIDYSVSLVNSNYVYEVDYYENGTYKNDTGWISGLTIIPKGQEFVLLIRKVDISDLVPTERNAISVLPKNIGTINESLEDYGLDNKFANGLVYGYCSYSGGNFSFEDLTENDGYIGSKTEYSCVGGEPLKILFSQTMEQITIQFNNNSFFTVNNVDKIETVIPSGVTKLSFYVKKNGIKISNIGYIGIYINNQIDSLKNDLSNLMKVETVAYSGTIDLGLYELAYDLPIVQGYTPIGVVGHSVSRIDGLYVHGSYLKDGKVYIDGYSNKNQGIVYATAFVLYAIN